ncbi:MAG: hypothetical protein GF353_19895 [Candidatus Lokiarchaeota archaeon]|nr:hypothetical protein [Candidatus Lokiarchaeota archaeon]
MCGQPDCVDCQGIKKRKASAPARGRRDLASGVSPGYGNMHTQSPRRGR